MSYLYLKNQAVPLEKMAKISPKPRRLLALFFLAGGLFLFSSALLPILRFQLEYSLKFGQIISPLSTRFYNQEGSILGDITTDYTQLSNWFVDDTASSFRQGQNQPLLNSASPSTYYLSVPSLKIKDALVTVGSMDLKKSLIQYPQTALPGQFGNTVIIGHSVLPQFFNPSSYLTIFSTLYKLKNGSEIYIDFDNVRYKYLVDEIFEVKPKDLSVLDQRFDDRYLTLITCSPPGTYLRRLIIKARIIEL